MSHIETAFPSFTDPLDVEFMLPQIDRHIGKYSREFTDREQKPLLEVCLDRYRAQGNLGVLDGGCGTGQAIYTLKDQLLFRTERKDCPESIQAVGVNFKDYSTHCRDKDVRAAMHNGYVQYRVGNCLGMEWGEQTFDFILMYEMLIYNEVENVAAMLLQYATLLKPQGRFYLNMFVSQRKSPEVTDAIGKLINEGLDCFELLREEDGNFRQFLMFEKD